MIMTTQEINIAISEACGWKRERVSDDFCGTTFEAWKRDGKRLIAAQALPDYCHDLNAMHEAEPVLFKHNLNSWQAYTDWLNAVCDYPIYRATARQRAEAFLKTKGLWKEEKP